MLIPRPPVTRPLDSWITSDRILIVEDTTTDEALGKKFSDRPHLVETNTFIIESRLKNTACLGVTPSGQIWKKIFEPK